MGYLTVKPTYLTVTPQDDLSNINKELKQPVKCFVEFYNQSLRGEKSERSTNRRGVFFFLASVFSEPNWKIETN